VSLLDTLMAKHGKTKSGVERAFSEFHSIYKPNSGGRRVVPLYSVWR
jgi:hypothetical protein